MSAGDGFGREGPDAASDDTLTLPAAFVENLIEPLFGDARLAPQAAALVGAPMALACADHCREPAIDTAALRAEAQVEAVAAKTLRSRILALCVSFANAGAPVVAIKGLASSMTLYPRPYLRLLPDADLLFHPADLPQVTRLLRLWGFASLPDAVAMRRWGALTEASFAPVTPPDQSFLIDVHCHVDDPPASNGISTDAVFVRSHTIETGAGELRVPDPAHAFCILALHAFRDFYEPRGLKSLFDAALLLQRHGATLDWGEVEHCARAGDFVERTVFYRELLARLGAGETGYLFPERGLTRRQGRLLASVAGNFRSLATYRVADLRKLALEAALYDSAGQTLRLNFARLRALFAPRSHCLAGLPRA